MKITFEISIEEFIKSGGILFTGRDELKLESGKPSIELTPEEDLKILAELKETLSKEKLPEEPAPEQTTPKVEILIDGEGWKQFGDIDEAAKTIDARREHLLFALGNNKTCNGMQVRYYNSKEERTVGNIRTKYTKVKVKKYRKEHPDKVIEVYDSISKCAKLNNLKYANLFQQLKKHKKYEYGLYVFQLTEEIDDTMEEIEKKNKEPYEISKNK